MDEHHWKFKVGSKRYDQYRVVRGQGFVDYPRIEVLSGGEWVVFVVSQPIAEEMLRLAEEVERLKDAAITQPPCPTCGAEQPDRACVRCGRDLRALDPLRHAAWHGAQQERARIRRELEEAWPRKTATPWTDREQDWIPVLNRIIPEE